MDANVASLDPPKSYPPVWQRMGQMRSRWLTDAGVRALLHSRAFWIVLAIKVAMGSLLASSFMRDLFIPFTNYFASSGFANPYEHFATIGRGNAFPYPPMMLFLLGIPRFLFSPVLSSGVDSVTILHLFVLHLPLLAADVVAAIILARWFPNRSREVLLFYWCSPFVIYVTYWHGQLDLLPTAIFLCALHLMRHRHFRWGMFAYALAVATKFHLLIALPFILVYTLQEARWQATLKAFGVFCLTAAVIVVPFLFGPGFRTMVLATEESQRIFAFRAPLGNELSILVGPLVILMMWFRFQAYPKRNWDLFLLYLGLVFSTFVLLAPPRPGYILWSLPFLIVILLKLNQRVWAAYAVAVASYFVFFWSSDQSDLFDAWRLVSVAWADRQADFQIGYGGRLLAPQNITDLSFTVLQASLGALTLSMYLFGVRSNSVYRLRTKPVMIGLAGDSGSGKDEVTKSIEMLLGEQRLSVIPGDDYHKWPRGHEMWKVYSHLDVRGNNLHAQVDHALAISGGNTIHKVHYDHRTGQFTEEEALDPNQFVLFQGLHSLSILQLRQMYDLSIFLDPDEELRRFWKIRRDVKMRGHEPAQVLASMEARAKDRNKYILPQRECAEVVISWRPIGEIDPHSDVTPELELQIFALNSFDFQTIAHRIETAGIEVAEFEPYVDSRWQLLRIRGTLAAAELQSIARDVIPSLEDLIVEPVFHPGLNGCLQLILLCALSSKLRYAEQRNA